MAINRAPWTALVDDDGSNLVGTVWNKDAIKTVLLDPIDAQVVPMGTWTPIPFSAANFQNQAGITAAMVPTNQYTVINKTLFWMMEQAGSPGAPAAFLLLTLPAGLSMDKSFSPVAHCWDNGTYTTGYTTRGAATTLGVSKTNGSAWTGPLYVYFTAIIALA